MLLLRFLSFLRLRRVAKSLSGHSLRPCETATAWPRRWHRHLTSVPRNSSGHPCWGGRCWKHYCRNHLQQYDLQPTLYASDSRIGLARGSASLSYHPTYAAHLFILCFGIPASNWYPPWWWQYTNRWRVQQVFPPLFNAFLSPKWVSSFWCENNYYPRLIIVVFKRQI